MASFCTALRFRPMCRSTSPLVSACPWHKDAADRHRLQQCPCGHGDAVLQSGIFQEAATLAPGENDPQSGDPLGWASTSAASHTARRWTSIRQLASAWTALSKFQPRRVVTATDNPAWATDLLYVTTSSSEPRLRRVRDTDRTGARAFPKLCASPTQPMNCTQ